MSAKSAISLSRRRSAPAKVARHDDPRGVTPALPRKFHPAFGDQQKLASRACELVIMGLVGGFLCFIPYVGAVAAAVPATLVALTRGPTYALSGIAMYAVVHFVEGNFITPFVQAEATSLPPVLSLLSIVAFGIIIGPASVFVAAPLTLFLMVVVELLYVEQALGQGPISTSKSPNG